MMNARLFVALAMPLVFVTPGLPESQLSAEQDSTSVNAADGAQAPTIVSTIAFTSTRDNHGLPWAVPPIVGGEIYFIDYLNDGTFSAPRRVTANAYTDIFPTLSPDGRGKVVFDSNRLRAAGEPVNTSDLFLMNHDGTEVRFLTRGGSPTWSPAGPHGGTSKDIAFHASASGAGLPINPFPGSATDDSDIFTVNVDDLLNNAAAPRNLTINRTATVDDDPSWSPDGRRIVFTSYVNNAPSTLTSSEIYIMNADGNFQTQLTSDGIEKRGATWSPDGTRILFACRAGAPTTAAPAVATFEICVTDAVPNSPITQLTLNNINELTPTWSPDGQLIVLHRTPANQLWIMRPDGSGLVPLAAAASSGFNLLATSWSAIDVGRREP
jgi:TolB protein